MGFYQQLRTSTLFLSALGFSLSAIAPLGAVETPETTPGSDGSQPRTASGAPKRTIVTGQQCISEFADLNGNGESERLTPMTVLAPTNNIISTSTTDPTLFIYIPQTVAEQAELVVDELIPTNDTESPFKYREVLYEEALPIPTSTTLGPRIVQYQFQDVYLEPGKTYAWNLNLLCDNAIPHNGSLAGHIICTEDCTIADHASEQQPPSWNEVLHFNAQQRGVNPEDWHTLLESQGLGCFKDVPFADEINVDYTVEDDPQCFVDGYIAKTPGIGQ